MNKISREFWFSAAHRIEGHPKCGRLHGHNYKVVISITGELDKHGMVMDFGELDGYIKPIIEMLDHYTIFSDTNVDSQPEFYGMCVEMGWAIRLPIRNSTAEVLAKWIHAQVWGTLNWNPEDISVLVQETPRNEAVFEFDKS